MTKEELIKELNKLDLKQLSEKDVDHIIWKTKIQSKEKILSRLYKENKMLKDENIKLKKQNMIFKNFIAKVSKNIASIF